SSSLRSTVAATAPRSRASSTMAPSTEPAGSQLAADLMPRGGSSALAPGECRTCDVIEDTSHQGARRARQPPGRMLAINPARHGDVGHGTDAAHGIERQQALEDAHALQAAVAIGQEIVEKEIPGHGDVGGAALGEYEADLRQAQCSLER